MQVAWNHPEDKKLATNSLENMGVKELHQYLRKCNADRNRGELNEQFSEWILSNEQFYCSKISNIYKVGYHKVQLAYYGMIYTILDYAGCYLIGTSSNPIGITRNRYCKELKLINRLQSNNVRKTIADDFYGHNYVLAIAAREKGEKILIDPILVKLESVFAEIFHNIKINFIS